MNPNELGFTLVLVALLLGLAGYFGWQQVRTLRGLSSRDELGADDQRYLRRQASRRLQCSVLMVVIAGLLIGGLFLDANRRQIQAQHEIDPAASKVEERKDLAHVFSIYWIAALFVLLLLLVLAAMDFWATARYGLSQHRKLQAAHRAMLEEQAARLRRGRNGQPHS